MPNFSIIEETDGYKPSHGWMLQDDTQVVYSYMEPRLGAQHDFVQVIGTQFTLLEYLEGVRVTLDDIYRAKAMFADYFGNDKIFNEAGWTYIATALGGRLPLKIKAVPEGTCVPVGNVIFTVENTDENCAWLTNYVESLLTHIWYPTTVATVSRSVRMMIERILTETGCGLEGADFMLHDFGYRGATSNEAAAIGGFAHITNFLGTDTIVAMVLAKNYYNHIGPAAFSVPASEHSVMTALGQGNDITVLDQLLEKFPTGILSVVADSYDIYKFTQAVCDRKDKILARDGKFVLRPDSVTSTDNTPESLTLQLVSMLHATFGGTKNEAGYVTLNPKVGVLWGDGIGPDGIEKILNTLKWAGFAADNMVFGMGGGLLQRNIDRDTERFAFKCSAQKRNGEWLDIQKNPLDASKKSKAGRLALVKGEDGMLTTVVGPREDDILETVFLDGEVTKTYTLEEIRARAAETSKIFA